MSGMPERIWADERCGYMFTQSLIVPCAQYVRADIHEAALAAKDERIAFLEKVAGQAIKCMDAWDLGCYLDGTYGNAPELAQYLREKEKTNNEQTP